MRRHSTPLIVTVVCFLSALPTLALDNAQFRQLIVLDDEYVADVLVDRADWLPDARGLVLGGWENWPDKPAIVIAPDEGQAVKLDRPATAHFALSPSGREIAYWVATGGVWTQLAVVPLHGGRARYIGEPRRVNSAMHLAWPSAYTLCTLIQDQQTSVAYAINAATGAARPLVQVEGGQWARLRAWSGWDPIAVWVGEDKKCFRLSAMGRSEEISADFDYDRARPDVTAFSYFDQDGGLWMGGMKDSAPVKLTDDAGAACWAPDGSMLLYAQRNALTCVWPPTRTKRQVMGSSLDRAGLEATAPLGMSWSPDGGTVAHWRQSGARGQVRRARLGLQEIVIRIRYDGKTQARVGQFIWVAKKLHFDAAGRVKEPVWETLKGQFAVRKLLPGVDETIVEAVNVGVQPGTLERIAGRTEPAVADVRAGGLAEFSLKPIPGLYAWLQDTQSAGELIGVEVRRVPLGSQP